MILTILLKVYCVVIVSCEFVSKDDDYGIDVRILGGYDAEVGEFPYQASIRYEGFGHFCGGSIIDEYTVLTAAHCVYNKDATQLSVAVGNNHRFGGEIHKVDYYIVHENFDNKLYTNDIALIKVKVRFEYNDRIRPVSLGTQHIPQGVTSVASGWGVSEIPQFSEYLQKVTLRTFDLQQCHELMYKTTSLVVTDTNICTSPLKGHATCIGDSGGPLVAHKYQIGIVSWSVGCGTGMPEVNTRVSSYIEWIQLHTVK